MHGTVRSGDEATRASSQERFPALAASGPAGWIGEGHAKEIPAGGAPRAPRACWWLVPLRGALLAIGLLILATVTAAVASAQSADLAITSVVGSPAVGCAGCLVSYSVTVTNNGPDIATNVQVVDVIPADTRWDGTICATGWAALAVGGPHGAVLCTISSLPPGMPVTHVFRMLTYADVPNGTAIPNMVFITSSTVDPSTTNNIASAATGIFISDIPTAVADLAVTKTGPAGPIPAGQNVGYTITVTNNGSAAAPTASFNDLTPPDTTFVSVLQTAGPTFNCTTPGMGAIGVVHCEIGSLAAAASATFTLTLQIDAGTPAMTQIPNVVLVASDVTDTTLTNNFAPAGTLVGSPPSNTPTPTATATATSTATDTTTPTATATATATPTTTVTLTATPNRIPGDFNGDGFVDIRDYGVWRQNFGQTNCGNPADANGDCLVDIRDYGIWRQHFGEGTPTDRRPGAALPTGISPAPRGTPGPVLLASDPAAGETWAALTTDGPGPAIPVIPLVGGLLGLGGLAGSRVRRPPRSE